MKRFFLAILIFCAGAIYAQEKEPAAGGPPTRNQLLGFWRLVAIPDAHLVNKVDPWPQKYQWFAFYDNGKVYSMMADQDASYSAKQLKDIFSTLPEARTPDFKYDGQFLLIVNKDKKNYLEKWGVNLFAQDINELFVKGRLIMSLDDGAGNAIYYRLLERVN